MTVRAGAPDLAPDGKPIVGPLDRAAWRSWLIANHATATGVYLALWRSAAVREGALGVAYAEAVEEALCVGWIDAIYRTLDEELAIQWFAPRRPGSGWASSNKARVERLAAAGLMLPAGLATVEAAKRSGAWTLLDDVEALVVPDDLAAALAMHPPARDHWDAFSASARRQTLFWVVSAKRPETRAKRIAEVAEKAARDEKAGERPPRERLTRDPRAAGG